MKLQIKYILLFALVILLFCADLLIGSVRIPISHLFDNDGIYYEIIHNFRLPKAITAILTGSAISIAGLIMQTLFQNPLAGPYVLGVSSGASLGVAIYILAGSILPIIFIQSGFGLIISATLGAVFVLLLVLMVSFKVRQAVSLLLIGIMFGQIAGSVVSILQNISNPDSLKLYITWTFGSLSAVTWDYMIIMAPIVFIGIAIVFLIQKSLNSLLLGENYAQGLGVNIKRTRLLIIIAISLLAGATTAFTGPIAFIGIAVPHIVRKVLKTSDHLYTTLGCIFIGSALLLLCDICTQLPSEGYILPINSISALIGAPIIIWIIVKQNKSTY
ncbi:MAG: iron ABC transporter permease [Paludibacteraceae bacterium]|nr:iron ABC transporter permease [Paludibacteraceae bacterium]